MGVICEGEEGSGKRVGRIAVGLGEIEGLSVQ